MPLERVSQGFKDISMVFKINPLNQDVITLRNASAIARSVRNLVMTFPGERFFSPDIGSKVSRSLFQNMSSIEASVIRDEIKYTIKTYEPRVELIDTIVTPLFDDNAFDVTLIYNIIGVDIPTQELTFALQPTR
jgi:phage baseplate assembly protein W